MEQKYQAEANSDSKFDFPSANFDPEAFLEELLNTKTLAWVSASMLFFGPSFLIPSTFLLFSSASFLVLFLCCFFPFLFFFLRTFPLHNLLLSLFFHLFVSSVRLQRLTMISSQKSRNSSQTCRCLCMKTTTRWFGVLSLFVVFVPFSLSLSLSVIVFCFDCVSFSSLVQLTRSGRWRMTWRAWKWALFFVFLHCASFLLIHVLGGDESAVFEHGWNQSSIRTDWKCPLNQSCPSREIFWVCLSFSLHPSMHFFVVLLPFSLRRLLKRLEFLFELPMRLSKSIEFGAYAQAVKYWRTSSSILEQYHHIKSFLKIQTESDAIISRLKIKLRQNVRWLYFFSSPAFSAVSLFFLCALRFEIRPKRRSLKWNMQHSSSIWMSHHLFFGRPCLIHVVKRLLPQCRKL